MRSAWSDSFWRFLWPLSPFYMHMIGKGAITCWLQCLIQGLKAWGLLLFFKVMKMLLLLLLNIINNSCCLYWQKQPSCWSLPVLKKLKTCNFKAMLKIFFKRIQQNVNIHRDLVSKELIGFCQYPIDVENCKCTLY